MDKYGSRRSTGTEEVGKIASSHVNMVSDNARLINETSCMPKGGFDEGTCTMSIDHPVLGPGPRW